MPVIVSREAERTHRNGFRADTGHRLFPKVSSPRPRAERADGKPGRWLSVTSVPESGRLRLAWCKDLAGIDGHVRADSTVIQTHSSSL